MKRSFLLLLTALVCPPSSAADASCAQQMGQQRAAQLARECRQVSPATHPPCNAANSCAMIIDELERGCSLLAGESYRPKFCTPNERAGSFQGYLYSGGGIDDRFITVLTEQGERITAYCIEQCGGLFGAPDENDAVALRRDQVGRRVAVEVTIERNAGRIAGPGRDERIFLVKRIKQLK